MKDFPFFNSDNDSGGLSMKKIIKIELNDTGKYSINASGFPLSENGMMEALWIIKDAQGTLKEAFETELNKHKEHCYKQSCSKKVETEMDNKIFENLAKEDVDWLKTKFSRKG